MPKPVYIGKTNRAILDGQLDLSEWDEDELLRGQRKGRNGRWVGAKPKVVPMAIHNELVKRRLSRAGELLRESLLDAVLLLREVITDKDASDADRIKASALVIDRVMGKAKEHVEIEVVPPWASALSNALVRGVVNNERDVIDVDPYEADDDD